MRYKLADRQLERQVCRRMRISLLILSVCFFLAEGCSNGKDSNSTNMNFTASGTISKVYLQEIQNKAKGGKSRVEARIEIKVGVDSSNPHFEEFAGESSLAKEYSVGQKVEIEATTSSGRHIRFIKILER